MQKAFLLAFVAVLACQQASADSSIIASIKQGASLDDIKSQVVLGANVNETDENGATPLMWAANSGRLDLAAYLVEKGADPKRNGVIMLESGGYYGNLLSIAAGRGDLPMVDFIVGKVGTPVDDIEFNPDTRAKDGWTALVWACENGNLDVVKYLVSKGANVNYQAKGTAQTPLTVAAGSGQLEVVKYLIEKGANASFEYNGMNPLTYANRFNQKDVFNYLEDLVNTVFVRSGSSADYNDVEMTIGNWDYGAAQFEESPRDAKFVFSCTVSDIGKDGANFNALIYTLKYSSALDRHHDGLIYVEFSARPKVNVGDVVILSCRYGGLTKLKSADGKTISVPRFIADKLRRRLQTMN